MKTISFISFILILCSPLIFTLKADENNHNIKIMSMNSIVPGIESAGMVKSGLNFGNFPLYFIINQGQVNDSVAFYAKTSKYTLWMTKEGLIFDSISKINYGDHPKHRTRLNKRNEPRTPDSFNLKYIKQQREVSRFIFLKANKNPAIVPVNETRHKINYFIGNDQTKWFRNIPTSQAVLYKDIYKDIDFKVYGIEKQIEYDWIVKPGGDPGDIRFEYKNVKKTRIDNQGNLLIETEFGKLLHKKPLGFQEIDKKKQTKVNVNYKKIGLNTYGFEVEAYDKNQQLFIDPVVLAYSTYLGGDNDDEGGSIAVDDSGRVYVTGFTDSINFPTLNYYQTDGDINDSASDVFVTKIDPTVGGTGSLIYSTYIGGDDNETGWGIAVDSSGNAYVTGYTGSTDFPTLNQYQADGDINDSSTDVFVTKLSPAGNSLLYSTYLGGDSGERGFGINLDSNSNVYVTGYTYSTNFPTLNQYQNYGDINDATANVFVTRIDTTLVGVNSLIYSTYLGGDSYDEADGIAVDSSGNAYVTGYTDSADFPTRNPYQTDADINDSLSDAFVTKIDTTGSGDSSLIYSTYLGGELDDGGWAIAVDSSGNVYVTGATLSATFPVVNSYQSNLEGLCDAFVAKLSSTGDSLLYSTYLGGGTGGYLLWVGFEEGNGIAVDSSGNAYITGYTTSTDFPVIDSFQSSHNGGFSDAFVTKISPTGDSLVYSSFLGGSDEEEGYAIALDSSNATYVTGFTYSINFPTSNPFASTIQGGGDSFVTKLVGSPTVNTLTVSNITLSSAESGGNITNSGGSAIIARGVCWSTSPNPTLSDSFTTDGSGTGTYTSFITGLAAATTYYVRAYATNSYSCTGYGNEEIFHTNVTISGTVTDGTNPLQGVIITFSHDNHTETTDASGNYSYTVPYGTTTTIIPNHAAVTSWNPTWIYLDNISANMSNQDFQAMIITSSTISGVITSGSSGLENVTMTGLPGNPTSNASGYYSAVVLNGWSGIVTPTLAGYIFTPQSISYTNVISDQTNQNYTALAGNPVISGTVRTSGGAGISGVTLTFSNSGGSVTTNTNGDYSHTVISGWSGTVRPSLNGYSFSPASISYSNVTSNQANQNYTALSNDNPVISGIIWTAAGNRLPGVTLIFSNNSGTATSDQNGLYSHQVTSGWSGTVTPSKEGYEFIPGSRFYTNVTTNQDNDDFISMINTGELPEILINRNQLYYGADISGPCTGSQTILVSNSGEGTLNWTASTNQAWLKCSPAAGADLGIIDVSVDANNLPVGTYTGVLTISAANAVNTPQTVNVTLNIYSTTKEPFGVFSTPINDSTVSSSIPVTGWVLDDVEVQSVKIYREAGNDLAYIGNAVFVEGARPDVELAYPGYPMNYRAGWGYMMLTNYLPNNGNGIFTFHAIATDLEGNTVTLGKKTITVDNANAVKPFGTIDDPGQGGIISGSKYINWGWVLTPKPNTIPTDGSTIDVYIDGINLGNPEYNIYRKDIASLLPDYNNSNGAVGKFYLDTTKYTNGVHTIQWTAVDDAGNKDGIGSRFFSIQNTGTSSRLSEVNSKWLGSALGIFSKLSSESGKPLEVVKRSGTKIKSLKIIPNSKGIGEIETKELKQIEINVGTSISKISGFMIRGSKLGSLPIGSTLQNGVFYWSPGPGFYGQYRLLFVVEENGRIYKKDLTVDIKSIFSGK